MSDTAEELSQTGLWMEGKLKGMDLIMEETDVEPTDELDEFLALSCSPPMNNSSIISSSDTSADSTSSPSSFESSFTSAIPKPSPVETEQYAKTMGTLSLNVPDKPPEVVDCLEQNGGKENEAETVIDGPQQTGPANEAEIIIIDGPQQTGTANEAETVIDGPQQTGTANEAETVIDGPQQTGPANEAETIIDDSQQTSTANEPETIIDGPQQTGAVTKAVCNSGVKLTQSRLPTPSEKLKNCSSLSRSPVKDTQLEYLKLFRDIDTTKVTPSLQTEFLSSNGSNDTYVIANGSSDERVAEALNTSATSEASSVSSTLSTDGSNATKKSKLPRIGFAPAVRSSKLVKPATKVSLLPSKPSKLLAKVSKSSLRQPARKTAGSAAPAIKPVRYSTVNKKASLRNQENAGVSSISSNPPLKSTRPPSKTRVRTSSIPKPVQVSKLRKSASSSTLVALSSTKQLEPSLPVHSTPIRSQTVTPSRKRPLPADIGENCAEQPSSISLSSIEGSVSTEKSSVVTMEILKTVTKRRSLLPKPVIDSGILDGKAVQQPLLASPVLPKKSLKPRALPVKHFISKLAPRGGALKPRNGPTARPKQDGPFKLVACHFDDFEMAGGGGGSKVVHSPLNKESAPSPPRSKWSPIKKTKNYNGEDASHMCTKRTAN